MSTAVIPAAELLVGHKVLVPVLHEFASVSSVESNGKRVSISTNIASFTRRTTDEVNILI